MAGRMAGKTALISGAASGLGEAQAKLFAQEGARLVLGDLQEATGQQGIRVNTTFPGQIRTPILGDITPEQDAAIQAAIPMGVVGDPMDVAYGALFLASGEARHVTGAEVWIDGGWYASH